MQAPLMEWEYNLLHVKLGLKPPTEAPITKPESKKTHPTEVALLSRGLLEERVYQVPSARRWDKQLVPVTALVVTEAGCQAMNESIRVWRALRLRHPEFGPASFAVCSSTLGQCFVRVPRGAGEVAEYAMRRKHGDCDPVVLRIVKDVAAEDGTTGSAFLDAMDPGLHAMPAMLSWTLRPLGDLRIEFMVTCGLPPNHVF